MEFYFKSRVEITVSLKSGCRGEEDYLNTVLILFYFKDVLQCRYCTGAKNVSVLINVPSGHPEKLVRGYHDTMRCQKELWRVLAGIPSG